MPTVDPISNCDVQRPIDQTLIGFRYSNSTFVGPMFLTPYQAVLLVQAFEPFLDRSQWSEMNDATWNSVEQTLVIVLSVLKGQIT